MAASAAFSVEGSTPTGAVAVAASSTVDLALLSTSGVNTVAWSIVGNHSSAASNPTITPAGSPSGATASFVMPAGAGQAYLVQCVVNGGVDANGDADAALTKRHIVGVNNAAGFVPFCVGEELERQATHGWTEELNDFAHDVGQPATFVYGSLVTVQTAEAHATTANATPAEGMTVAFPSADCSLHIVAVIHLRDPATDDVAIFKRGASFKCIGGTGSQIGITDTILDHEETALLAADVDIDTDTEIVRVMVTGIAATDLDWDITAQMTMVNY